MEKPIKCEFCGTRYVKQQEWKKGFEKTHCATCIAFIKSMIEFEKALNEEARALHIPKHIWIKMKMQPEDALLEAIGIGDGLKSQLKS